MNIFAYILIGSFYLQLTQCTATCNPLKESNCPADPALGKSISDKFHSKSEYFKEISSGGVSYTDDGLKLSLKKKGDNPTLKSDFYIMFGRIEVVMKAAVGNGIISSFYLQSDDLDEIDIELFGGNGYQFASNYFSKGDTSTFNRGEYHSTGSNPLENFHTYTLDWTKNGLVWAIDGKVVRALLPNAKQGYPQLPMYIMMGLWAGGDKSNPEGTIKWAGGLTDYDDAPFNMYIRSIIVCDYSTGDEYSYDDKLGKMESIKAKNGEIYGRHSQAKKDYFDLEKKVGTTFTVSDTGDSEDSTPTTKNAATTTKYQPTTITQTVTTRVTDNAGNYVTVTTEIAGTTDDTGSSPTSKSYNNGLWTEDGDSYITSLIDSNEQASFSYSYSYTNGMIGHKTSFTSHHGSGASGDYSLSDNGSNKNGIPFMGLIILLANFVF